MPEETQILYRLALVVGLGLLIGMQRERVDDPLAGFRTFPLIGLAGALAAWLGDSMELVWLLPAALLAVVAALIAGNMVLDKNGSDAGGQTTDMAAVVMFLVGAQAIVGQLWVAAAIAGTVAVLLHFKKGMHALVDRLSETDVKAVMQFVLITMIILPLLPNETYGPYDVFNPFETWLMVVLIVGLNLGGYVALRIVGQRGGSLLAGLLGGLVSSTAATASLSKQAGAQMARGLAAIAIMLASTVVVVRLMVELAVVSRSTLVEGAIPLGLMLAVNIVICAVAWFMIERNDDAKQPEVDNPAKLKTALVFGGLYALIKLLVAFTQDKFGDTGLYVVAVVSGLTDVDAITLSTGQLASAGSIATDTAWRVILVAALANLTFKGGIALTVGGWKLFRIVGLMFGLSMLGGLGLVLFWP